MGSQSKRRSKGASDSKHSGSESRSGVFNSEIEGALSDCFGTSMGGLSADFGNSFNNEILAAGTTMGSSMSFAPGISQDTSDSHSMEVIGHEVSHALAGGGSGKTLLDAPGDPGESRADVAGQQFSSYVSGGMEGPAPQLEAATGGEATIHRFKLLDHDVHEDITRKAMEKAGLGADTGGWDQNNTEYLRGVYWNDDPAGHMFRSSQNQRVQFPKPPTMAPDNSVLDKSGIVDWGINYDKGHHLAEEGHKFGPGDEITGRSHYGDLQYLHGMASREGEDAADTQKKMLEWGDFTARVASGELDGDAQLPPDMLKKFPERANMSVNQFFGIKDGKGNVKERAMGSMLHMVQDSYAEGHAERNADGEIVQFHNYDGQDSGLHGEHDKDTAQTRANQAHAVDASADLLKIMNDPTLSAEEKTQAMQGKLKHTLRLQGEKQNKGTPIIGKKGAVYDTYGESEKGDGDGLDFCDRHDDGTKRIKHDADFAGPGEQFKPKEEPWWTWLPSKGIGPKKDM